MSVKTQSQGKPYSCIDLFHLHSRASPNLDTKERIPLTVAMNLNILLALRSQKQKTYQ